MCSWLTPFSCYETKMSQWKRNNRSENLTITHPYTVSPIYSVMQIHNTISYLLVLKLLKLTSFHHHMLTHHYESYQQLYLKRKNPIQNVSHLSSSLSSLPQEAPESATPLRPLPVVDWWELRIVEWGTQCWKQQRFKWNMKRKKKRNEISVNDLSLSKGLNVNTETVLFS